MKEKTCASCRFSRDGDGLTKDHKYWCNLRKFAAIKVCKLYEYEPGTEEEE